jgi:Domain of unknown function (DUF397)
MYEVEYAGWRKSRRSESSGNCVEVGAALGRRVVGVRDSKHLGHGPVLMFTASVWEAFTVAVRDGETSL